MRSFCEGSDFQVFDTTTTRLGEKIPYSIKLNKYIHPLYVFPTPDLPSKRILYAGTFVLSFPRTIFFESDSVLLNSSLGVIFSIYISTKNITTKMNSEEP